MEDFLLLSTSFLASMGGLALSILFCIVLIKIMFRQPKLNEEQLAALRERPITFMMPTHSTDVFGKQIEVRRQLEKEASEAQRERR
jgi:hypothetical protein